MELIYTSDKPLKASKGMYAILSDDSDASRHTAVLSLDESSDTNSVLIDVIAQGVTVNSFKELVPRMNDIFIKLVTEEE